MDLLKNNRLNFQSLPHADILAVTSGKGGVGKTSISVNLAILFKQYRKRVLLIDADIHLGNVDLVLGIRPTLTMSDVILGKKELGDTIISGPGEIDILPASSGVLELLECDASLIKKLNRAFQSFENKYDVILIDTGAGLSTNVLSFVASSHRTLLIVTPDPSSIADAYGMIKVVAKTKPNQPIILLTNMVSSMEEGKSLFQKLNLMTTRFLNFKLENGGSIPNSKDWSDCVLQQLPLAIKHNNSTPIRMLKMISKKILSVPITKEDQQGLFDGFLDENQPSSQVSHD
ncbi:MAG: MinD/ParA family protein [FCB group bacterium]|nr:MinD/ParA family protein [FCB group bacterium]